MVNYVNEHVQYIKQKEKRGLLRYLQFIVISLLLMWSMYRVVWADIESSGYLQMGLSVVVTISVIVILYKNIVS